MRRWHGSIVRTQLAQLSSERSFSVPLGCHPSSSFFEVANRSGFAPGRRGSVRRPVATGQRTRYYEEVPRLRTSQHDKVQVAIEELATVASGIRGLDIKHDHTDRVTVTVGKENWPANVLALDAVSEGLAEQLVATETSGSKIVVANQLSAEAKDVLARTNESSGTFGWSWLDRRGELQLNHPTAIGTVHFDQGALDPRSALPSGWSLPTPASDGPIRGRPASATRRRCFSTRPNGLLFACRRCRRTSHGAVGDAAKLLQNAGLILPRRTRGSRPVLGSCRSLGRPDHAGGIHADVDQAQRWGARTMTPKSRGGPRWRRPSRRVGGACFCGRRSAMDLGAGRGRCPACRTITLHGLVGGLCGGHRRTSHAFGLPSPTTTTHPSRATVSPDTPSSVSRGRTGSGPGAGSWNPRPMDPRLSGYPPCLVIPH